MTFFFMNSLMTYNDGILKNVFNIKSLTFRALSYLVSCAELAVGSHPPGVAVTLLGDGVADGRPTGHLHSWGVQAGDLGGHHGLLFRVLSQTKPAVLAPAQCEHFARALQVDGVMLT